MDLRSHKSRSTLDASDPRQTAQLGARLIEGLQALDEVTFAAGPIEPGIGERISARAEAALGQERFAELVAEGRKLDQASLLALARKIGKGGSGLPAGQR